MVKARPRVVVADDDNMLRALLKVILRDEGCEVIGEADNGEEALALCRERAPDVLCLDVNMPGLSGLETLEQMRREGLTLPVVMVTADASLTTVRETMAYGVSGYIIKPFNARYVGEVVRQAARCPQSDRSGA